LLDLSYLGKLTAQHGEGILLVTAQAFEPYMIEKYLERITNAAQLPTITPDLIHCGPAQSC
jgi:hypothetical protein